MLFERAVIAGVGLIGGSLALAGKKAGLFGKVVGLSRNQATIEKAVELGIIDEGTTDPQKGVKGADLLFVATPVQSIAPLILSVEKSLEPDCIVTDGGSVKGPIVDQIEKRLKFPERFVGAHPVAGDEKSGPESAFPTLYEDRYTILTPTDITSMRAVERIEKMWQAVGSKTVIMTPEKHDTALAAISHLPHLVAYCLVESLDECDPEGVARAFIAGGFKDTTRIAASHPGMWRDIFDMNREKTLEMVATFERQLSDYKKIISEGDFDRLEEKLRRVRDLRLSMSGES